MCLMTSQSSFVFTRGVGLTSLTMIEDVFCEVSVKGIISSVIALIGLEVFFYSVTRGR